MCEKVEKRTYVRCLPYLVTLYCQVHDRGRACRVYVSVLSPGGMRFKTSTS